MVASVVGLAGGAVAATAPADTEEDMCAGGGAAIDGGAVISDGGK